MIQGIGHKSLNIEQSQVKEERLNILPYASPFHQTPHPHHQQIVQSKEYATRTQY